MKMELIKRNYNVVYEFSVVGWYLIRTQKCPEGGDWHTSNLIDNNLLWNTSYILQNFSIFIYSFKKLLFKLNTTITCLYTVLIPAWKETQTIVPSR